MKRYNVLNYAVDEKIRVLGENEVPTLVPSEKLLVLMNGDGAPYFKIQAIKYPIRGSGGIYEESFFQSFVDVTNSRPIPGAKRGHWRANRPESDFYMIGGKLEPNGDGTGTVYFKNYIPPLGDGSDNARFIQDAKAGIVNFSLVSAPSYTVDENGVYHFTGTEGYERNDAVEFGTGAMKQQTNADGESLIESSVRKLRELIKAGEVDRNSKWTPPAEVDKKWFLIENENEPEDSKARYSYPYGKDGKVYRSALRSIASRAAQNDLEDLATLATEMLAIVDSEGEKMNKEEMLLKLTNMRTNGELTNVELVKAFGLVLENTEEVTRLKTENSALTAKLAQTETIRVNAFMDKEFGTEGLLRDYAGKQLNSMDPAKVEEFKKDPVALQLAGNQTDITFFGKVDNSNQIPPAKTVGGVKIVEV